MGTYEGYYNLIVAAVNAVFDYYKNNPKWPREDTHKNFSEPLSKLHKRFYIRSDSGNSNMPPYSTKLKQNYNIKDFNDASQFNKFVQEYWTKFYIALQKLKLDSKLQDVEFRNPVASGGNTISFDEVIQRLSKMTVIADVLLTISNIPSSDLVGKYECDSDPVHESYFIYLHLAESGRDDNHKDMIALVTHQQKIIHRHIIPYPQFSDPKDDKNNDFCNSVYKAFEDCHKIIIEDIKNNNPNHYTYKFIAQENEEIKQNIKWLFDNVLLEPGMFIEDAYYQAPAEWTEYESNQQNNTNKDSESSTINNELKIQVNYSHIDILNKIMQKCQKEKIKYKFEKIASLKRRLIYAFTKYAIKNNELLQAFNKVCDTNNTVLVATYYAKKREDENDQLDENYCAGIIVLLNNTFLTIPSHAYSNFYNIINEYNRKKNELQNRSVFKKVKDTFFNSGEKMVESVLPNNLTIADIAANPYINKNKAIYKYIIKHVDGFKEFYSFSEANKFLKQYTMAQYIKLEPAFSHLSSNETQAKEHVLQLTLNSINKRSLFTDIKKIISDNQKYILNFNEVQQVLDKMTSMFNRLKK